MDFIKGNCEARMAAEIMTPTGKPWNPKKVAFFGQKI